MTSPTSPKLFHWRPNLKSSKKQQTVALSSTEAEYMALGDAVKELLWLKQVLGELKIELTQIPVIYEDNQGALILADHPVHHQRTKHIDIKHHFIRDHTGTDVVIQPIGTNEMLADVLTKSLGRIKFGLFSSMLGTDK